MIAPLTHDQLEVVMYVANGLKYGEVAKATHRSRSSVDKIIIAARKNAGAATTAHLVSMVIAEGLLVWSQEGNERVMNGGANESESNHLDE